MILNYLWVGFFLISFLIALFKLIFLGDIEIFPKLVNSVFDMSKVAFDISIGLTGILALWMGLMKIGEKGGMVELLAKVANPFFSKIFPEIPRNHPAMASILMNISANMLGLDNAGTPIGLKAMEQLQSLNPKKDTATNSQIMFLVLNTSGLTIIPITVIMYRAQFGAVYPADVFIPILLSTLCSTIGGLIIVSIYQKINLFNKIVIFYLGSLLVFVGLTIWYFSQLEIDKVTEISTLISNVLLFSVIIFLITLAFFRKVNVYESFIEGAKEGFNVAIKIIPYLVAILVAIGVFRTSGALDAIVSGIGIVVGFLGFDTAFVEALPTAFMKPLSGSGARGMMIDAMKTFGPDDFRAKLAGTFQGATDTTLYIIAVYFGSVSIKKTRYAITCGLAADLIGIIAAIFISYLFYAS